MTRGGDKVCLSVMMLVSYGVSRSAKLRAALTKPEWMAVLGEIRVLVLILSVTYNKLDFPSVKKLANQLLRSMLCQYFLSTDRHQKGPDKKPQQTLSVSVRSLVRYLADVRTLAEDNTLRSSRAHDRTFHENVRRDARRS